MTNKELLKELQGLSAEQLNQDVTIYDAESDEYFGNVTCIITDDSCDVLDSGSLVLNLEKLDLDSDENE